MEGRKPTLLFHRLVLVGFLTVASGSLSILVGMALLSGTNPPLGLALFVIYGLPLSSVVGVVLMVSMWTVWSVTFASLAQRFSDTKTRATIASSICSAIGATGLIALLAGNDDVQQLEIIELSPFAAFPVVMSAGLTWRAFSA